MAKKKVAKTKSVKKQKRPSIPRSVQLKLWVLSAGRCQFRGCNKPLWKDSLTLHEINYSNIGHIISWTETGPRGDRVKSPKLATNFKNLMLVCSAHNKTIDDKKLVGKYPVKLLTEFKKEHEDRIRTLCNIRESDKTHVLILKGKIGGHQVEVDEQDAYQAILPRYPASEVGIHIDLTQFSDDSPEFWASCVSAIREEVNNKLGNRNDNKKIKHLSIFAFAPIPLLMKLGQIVGDKISADAFQYDRTSLNWIWKDENIQHSEFQFNCLQKNESSKDVVLLLSLSGKISPEDSLKFVKKDCSVYEITIPEPNPLFIKNKKQLTQYKEIYWKAVSKISADHGTDCKIHLFPAIPLTIAIESGRSILPKVHPKILIYDKDHKHGGFRYIFDLQD